MTKYTKKLWYAWTYGRDDIPPWQKAIVRAEYAARQKFIDLCYIEFVYEMLPERLQVWIFKSDLTYPPPKK